MHINRCFFMTAMMYYYNGNFKVLVKQSSDGLYSKIVDSVEFQQERIFSVNMYKDV